MIYHREPRSVGETILLAGTQYTIDSVLGMGGSCIVYTAYYGDQLNKSQRHHVLIKELYPFQPRGEIYRADDGAIRCTESSFSEFQLAKDAFFRGNQVNLELLEKSPESTSGNLISCQAYGTYYSVLAVHGGQSLEQQLESREVDSLKDVCNLMLQIADALEVFHKNDLLNLDVSPDNILILPKQVMLIDYNSCQMTSSAGGKDLTFSIKPGYSAPEIRLQDTAAIGVPSDLYAVCAVFFRLLMGRSLSAQEECGKLKRRELESAAILVKESPPTISKTLDILRKGLHPLPRKRYQSTDEFALDLKELLRRIHGYGVTYSALWEMSHAGLCAQRSQPKVYLEQEISADETHKSREALYQELCRGSSILLKGPGGMGKSTLLAQMQREHLETYREDSVVPLYIPLVEYQQTNGRAEFIRDYILRHLRLAEGEHTKDALLQLEHLIEGAGGPPRLIFFLDGLNEAGKHREPLLREIEALAASGNVGVLVTDRSDAVKEYALSSFQTGELLPLSEENVRQVLTSHTLSFPEQSEVRQLLQNPMLLNLYCESGGGELLTQEDIVGSYLENLCQRELRLDSGDTVMELRHRYLIQQLLPEIALKQKKHGRPLSTKEVYHIAARGHKQLQSRAYGLAFPDYLGKSRQMFQDLKNESEWFDFCVTEQMVQELNLLVCHDGAYYGLVHDNFLPFLTNQAVIHRRIYVKSAWKRWAVEAFSLSLAGTLVCYGGVKFYQQNMTGGKPQYNEEQQALVDEHLQYLSMNLSVLNSQWAALEKVLERVDSGESDEAISQEITRQRQELERCSKRLYSDADFIADLADFESGIPLEQLSALYAHPKEETEYLEQILDYMQGRFCSDGSGSFYLKDTKRRAELASSFRDWLEKDKQVCFLQYSMVVQSLPEESQSVLSENIRYISSFTAYIASAPEQNDLEESLEKAQIQLKEAQTNVEAILLAYEAAG